MFRSGAFVAEQVTPVDDQQVQPAGVDLTLAAVFEPMEPGRISTHDKEIGERQPVEVEQIGEHVPDTYYLPSGGYVVRYGETIAVPADHVGFVFPRSTLLRNACMLNTAVWDPGYEGRGEGFLQVFQDIQIEAGARIGQFVLAPAEAAGTYDGDYQHENE